MKTSLVLWSVVAVSVLALALLRIPRAGGATIGNGFRRAVAGLAWAAIIVVALVVLILEWLR